jgi:hypothetical protein
MEEALKKFAVTIVRSTWGDSGELDGLQIQDLAEKLGVIVEVPYDPAVHGSNDIGVLPGEPWFVFPDSLKDVLSEPVV